MVSANFTRLDFGNQPSIPSLPGNPASPLKFIYCRDNPAPQVSFQVLRLSSIFLRTVPQADLVRKDSR